MKKAFLYAVSVYIILLGLQFFMVKKYTFKFYPSNVTVEQQATAKPCQLEPNEKLRGILFLLGILSLAFVWTYGNEKGDKKAK